MNFETEKSLEDALSLLNQEWTHSFVFSQERYIEARQLGYAVGKSQCLLAELQVSVIPRKIQAARSITVDEHFNLLFLPSFTSGTTTVGFEVVDHNKIVNVFTKVPRYVSKFVRDDERGVFLSIGEHPGLGVTDVTFGVMSSPGQRDHVLAQFHFKAFRKMVSKLKYGFNWDELRRSLTYCYCSVERRPCVTCGSTSDKGCECKLPMKRKIHPLDLTSEAHNIGVYEGVFRGAAELKVYSKGRTIYTYNFDSYSEAHFIDNSRLQEELLRWAAQRCIGGCSPTLTMLPAPPPFHGGMSLLHTDRLYFMKEMMDMFPQLANETNWKPQHMAIDPSMTDFTVHERGPFLNSQTYKVGAANLDPGTFREFGVQGPLNMLELFRKEGRFQGSLRNSGALRREGHTAYEEDGDQDCSVAAVSTGTTGKLLPSTGLCDVDESTTFDIETSGGPQAFPSAVPFLEDITAPQLDTETDQFFQRTTESISVLGAGAVDPNSLAISVPSMVTRHEYNSTQSGRPLYPASSNIDGMSLGQRNRLSDETARKRELRKARNRESARRSSIRKNLKFQKLQEDLANMKQVEAKLRRREQCMRKENISLRAAIQR